MARYSRTDHGKDRLDIDGEKDAYGHTLGLWTWEPDACPAPPVHTRHSTDDLGGGPW
jgi:hypothetical protein